MVTKEESLSCNNFVQVARIPDSRTPYDAIQNLNTLYECVALPKPIKWHRNGKTKYWVTRPDHFKIPIKHGLYAFGYITQDNAHLFNCVT